MHNFFNQFKRIRSWKFQILEAQYLFLDRVA